MLHNSSTHDTLGYHYGPDTETVSNHSGGGGPHKLINIKVASDSNALLFYSEESWADASPNYQVS